MQVRVHGGLGRLEKKGRMSSIVAEEVCGISSGVPTVCVEPGGAWSFRYSSGALW